MNPDEIHWEGPEFEHREKNVGWYWMTIIIAVAMLGVAVWQRNFLFAILVVMGEILVLVWSGKEPLMVRFSITDHGLAIGDRTRYALSDIHSFSIEPNEHAHWPVISFVLKRKFRPPVHVRAPQDRISAIRERLAGSIPEAPWEESLIDTLEKFFGF